MPETCQKPRCQIPRVSSCKARLEPRPNLVSLSKLQISGNIVDRARGAGTSRKEATPVMPIYFTSTLSCSCQRTRLTIHAGRAADTCFNSVFKPPVSSMTHKSTHLSPAHGTPEDGLCRNHGFPGGFCASQSLSVIGSVEEPASQRTLTTTRQLGQNAGPKNPKNTSPPDLAIGMSSDF